MINTTYVYLSSTLDLMYNNKQEKEVEEIISKSTCYKLDKLVYFIVNKDIDIEEIVK